MLLDSVPVVLGFVYRQIHGIGGRSLLFGLGSATTNVLDAACGQDLRQTWARLSHIPQRAANDDEALLWYESICCWCIANKQWQVASKFTFQAARPISALRSGGHSKRPSIMPRLLLRVVESRANCGEDLVTEGRLTFLSFIFTLRNKIGWQRGGCRGRISELKW